MIGKLWNFENLLALWETTPINNYDDKLIRYLEDGDPFGVSSFYNHIASHNSTTRSVFPAKMIWKANTPPRISFFAWEACKDRILTINNLMTRGIILTNSCFLCKNNTETCNHLLLWCPIMYFLWSMVYLAHVW